MSSEYPSNAEYNKLVWDGIPEIIQSDGLCVETRILDDEEVVRHLKIKAVEESEELESAEGLEEIKKEMADLLEVLHSLVKRLGLSINEIEELRKERAIKRGGFEDGVFLIRTYKEDWF